MRYYSIFSGIEAASVAWEPLGWEPLVFSEIDEFPSAVLAERFPDVPNLGDITEVDWKKAVKTYGKPDIVVGGSPCQSFSIAGGRSGLDGASGLMWEYVRCVRDVRPDWLLWENVPGALSSTHGEDFRCLLEALDAIGYGLAWRVLDAQFFGVAQRRERVFVVGRLGDVEGPCQVLFDAEGLRRDFEPSREKRKALASVSGRRPANTDAICMTDTQPHSMVSDEICGRLSSTMHKDPPVTMKIRGGRPGGGKGPLLQTDMSATLATSNDQTLFQPVAFAANQRGELRLMGGDGSISGTINASQSGKQVSGVCEGYEVRKLTPRECERLMGMPDDWTKIPYRGKPADECPDGPRYRAIGNSMAVSVMKWIGARIDAVERGLEPDEACSRIRAEIFGNPYREGLFSRQR